MGRFVSYSVILIFFISHLFLYFLSAGQQDQSCSLSGKITLDDSGPAEGVEVKLFSSTARTTQTVITDKQGAYHFPGLAPGYYEIEMGKEGYFSVESGRVIHINPGEHALNPNYQLVSEKNFGCLSGKITLEDGTPANEAQISLVPMSYSPDLQGRSTHTDKRGIYTIKNSAGNYHFKLEKKGYALESKKVTLIAQDYIENFDIQLIPGSEISGRVVDNTGRPLASATINLRRMAKNGNEDIEDSYPGFATSDEQGSYTFAGVKPGEYKIRAAPKSQSRETTSIFKECFYSGIPYDSVEIVKVELGARLLNMDIHCGLQMSGFVASGKVIDSISGMPVPNIRLSYGAASNYQQIGFLEKTDVATNSNGEFRITGLKPGNYWLRALSTAPSDYYALPQLFSIESGDVANLEHGMQRGVQISGRVFMENGLPPQENKLAFTIFFEPAPIYEESKVQYANRINMGMAKNSGLSSDEVFTIHAVPPGIGKLSYSERNNLGNIYSARIELNGVDLQEPFKVENQDIANVKVTLYRHSGIIAGYVYDEKGELNTERTSIVAVLKNSPYGFFSKSVNVNIDGRFVFKDLPKGKYDIQAVYHYEGSLVGSLGTTTSVQVSDEPAILEMKVRAPIERNIDNSRIGQ